MRISIFTLHGANNVGAFLQAYFLQSTLSKFAEVENARLVKFPSKAEHSSKLQKAMRLLKERKLGMMLFKYQTAKKYAGIYSKLDYESESFREENEYDVVVIGSDEVWNVNSQSFIHYPQYFGKSLRANKIVSYAPSANNATAEDIASAGMNFDSFDAVSVRDANTYRAVVTTTDGVVQPTLVCDPTVLPENFDEFLHAVPMKDYILVYSYGLSKEDIRSIRAYATKKKKKLVSVGTYNSWCDKNVVVDPIEFLSWLNGADEVISSTFHGTVLSVRLHKKIAVYSKSSHKVLDFLASVGLEARLVGDDKCLENVMARDIAYDEVENKLRELRDTSMNFIRSALEI